MPQRRKLLGGDSGGGGSSGDGKPKAKLGNIVLAAMASAGAAMYACRPQDPVLEVKSITVRGFNLRTSTDSVFLAVIDINLTLFVKIVNPNILPIRFTSTVMDIFYQGSLLGQAMIYPGSQEARSEQVLEIPAKLDGLEATHHLRDLFLDVTKREMMMHASVTIYGDIVVWKYTHRFEVFVKSDIKVDPIFLDVLEQAHRVDLNIEGVALPGMHK